MNKNLLKSSWILVGMLILVGIALALITSIFAGFFGISDSALSLIIPIIAAMFVGSIYSKNFKEIMPKKLRAKVTAIFMLVQIVVGAFYFFAAGYPAELVLFAVVAVLLLLYSLIIYWALGVTGRKYAASMPSAKGKKKSRKR